MGVAVTGTASLLSGPLLVLGLGAFLAPASCRDMSLHHPPVSAELVVPKKIRPPMWDSKMSGQISYSLHITGKKHIVHLLPKKMLLPRHLPVFTYAATKDALHEEDPFFRKDCYYYGYIEGISKSLAALSTCLGGLWGILKVNEKYYQIQPNPASSTFEHYLYPIANTGASNLIRALAKEEIDEDFFQRQGATSPPCTATFNDVHMCSQKVEMGVVVGKLGYGSQNSNATTVLQDMLFTLNLVDTLFMQIKAHASLSSLELWTNPSPMKIIKKLRSVLHSSAQLKSRSPAEQQLCDLVHLFQQHSFDLIFGIDIRTAKCNPYPSLAIKAHFGAHLIIFSVLFSREMGHNLGKPSDEGNLQGQRKPSIVDSKAKNSHFLKSCTFDSHLTLLGSGGNCLSGTSEEKMKKQKCGNKIIEEGEECDCGSKKDCRKNPCCQQGCILSKGAECSTGLCCKDCKILPTGRVCRVQTNECDLPEFCNGRSGICPDDIYKQDGTPCSGKGYCYKKRCGSHLQQCQALFGQQAENAPHQCYKEVNSRGDRFGNCGRGQISIFKGCNAQNILCGRLQCANIDIIPQVPHYYTLIQTYLKEPLEKEGVLCWGTAFNQTAKKGLIDLGAVEDGSSCGENMMCVNKTCLNISSIQQECVPEQCNFQGVCNSRGNCHCDFGWAPPFCQNSGYGGSSDSGPTVDLGSETNTSFLSWRTYLIRGSICSSFVMLKWAVIMLYKKRKWKKT